jgi:hypothetical protein
MNLDYEIMLWGFLAGAVVVMGLGLSVKILFSTLDTSKTATKTSVYYKYAWASLAFVLQFLAAIFFLTGGPDKVTLSDNVSLGVGMLSGIFLGTLIFLPILKKIRKKH